MFIRIKKYIYNLFENFFFFIRYNFKNINNEQKNIQLVLNEINNKIITINQHLLLFKIFAYYTEHSDLVDKYRNELSYLKETSDTLSAFPYKKLREINRIQSGYDEHLSLPYVVHNNKKLYFPNTWTVDGAVFTYKKFIENENLLGGNYREKSPHQYESNNYYIKEGSIVVDLGCAEGLFALHSIDKSSKVYLIESEKCWIEPLNATFAPYRDKVLIINKLVSNLDSESTITLSSILQNEITKPIFVKMDIEGYEIPVINSSKSFLNQTIDITFACCTYHRQNDAKELEKIFAELNYDTEFSDGYMLFIWDKLEPPYFRKGIIRAKSHI